MVVSGCVGPRGDGYDPGTVMSADEAQAYHAEQIGVFARSGADMVTAITMTNANEAVGLTRAAQAAACRSRSPSRSRRTGGCRRGRACARRSRRWTVRPKDGPAYYMINCAHPTHFDTTLASDERMGEAHPRHPRQCLAGAATPSSTRRPTSTPAIPWSWADSTARCGGGIRRSTCWAAAAAPTSRHIERDLRGVRGVT